MTAAEERPRVPSSTRMWAAGTVFSSRYRVVQLLGAGGMAEVYEVEHVLTHKRLALKLLRPEVLSHPESAERFFREASVCAGIDSEHVVEMLDCDIDRASASPFLVMELLQGTDLSKYIREMRAAKTTIPTGFILELLRQVASALGKIHAQGIVHRDLKPANLFLTFPGDGPPRVKILDFGIARLLSDQDSGGSPRLGTPLYMAPEQLTADTKITPATDLWALGLIAYELFVGVPYWEGNTAKSLAERIPDRNAHPAPGVLADHHGVSLAPGFDRWLLRVIDPEPSRRPGTASECIGQLFRLHDPSATQPPPRAGASVPSAVQAVEIPLNAPVPRVSLRPLTPSSPVPSPLPSAPPFFEVRDTDEAPAVDPSSMARTREIRRTPPPRKVASGKPQVPKALSPAQSARGAASGMHLTRRIRTRLRPPSPPPVLQNRGLPVYVPPSRPIPRSPPDTVSVLPARASSSAPVSVPRPLPTPSAPPSPLPSPEASVAPSSVPQGSSSGPSPHPSEPVMGSSAGVHRAPPKRVETLQAPPPERVLMASADGAPVRPRVSSRHEPAVKPWALWSAAGVTLVLALGAGREIVRDSRGSRRPLVGASMPTQEPPWRALAAMERAALNGASRAWTSRIARSQQPDGSFSGDDNLPSSGWDTGQQLWALLAGQRVGIPVSPDAQLSALRVLDEFRVHDGWAGATARDQTVHASTVATAWATLAYAALAESTHAEAARDRAVSAREVLMAAQRDDGAFTFSPTGALAEAPGSFFATVMALWALAEVERGVVERGGVGESARAVESRHKAMRWMRAALGSERMVVPGESPPGQVAGLLEMAFWVFWRARAVTHDIDAQDLGLATRAASGLLARCAIPATSSAPCARGTHANMAVALLTGPGGETVTAVVPWMPWTFLSATTLLRDPSVPMVDSVRAGLSVVVRRSAAVYELDREAIGRSPLAVLAAHVCAATEIIR